MNPDNSNSNPQQDPNQNLQKLEQDLEDLTEQVKTNEQVGSVPQDPQSQESPVTPQTNPVITSAPIPDPSSVPQPPPVSDPPTTPYENSKKGSPLMSFAVFLLVVAVVVAAGYIAYTKFLIPKAPTVTVPIETETPVVLPTPEEIPMSTESAFSTLLPTSTPSASATPSASSTPSAMPSATP